MFGIEKTKQCSCFICQKEKTCSFIENKDNLSLYICKECLDTIEDECILKFVEERKKNDNGKRYTLKDIENMLNKK